MPEGLAPFGLAAGGRGFHEAGPGRHGDDARESAAHDLLRPIEADPHARGQVRREADEPRIGMIVGRPGLAAGRQAESALARGVTGAVIDDIGEHRGHQIGGRFAEHAPADRFAAIEHAAVAIFNAQNITGDCNTPPLANAV